MLRHEGLQRKQKSISLRSLLRHKKDKNRQVYACNVGLRDIGRRKILRVESITVCAFCGRKKFLAPACKPTQDYTRNKTHIKTSRILKICSKLFPVC